MKKTTHIFKTIMAIAVVTILVACKKDIELRQNDMQARYNVITDAQVINPSAVAKTNPGTSPGFYIGHPDTVRSGYTSQGKK